MNLTEQFLNEIEQCDTELKARNLIGQVYQKANTTSEGFLKAPFPLTWDVFYKLVELEKKFNLNYFASSYIALVLVKPKLSSNWAKRAHSCTHCS